jgi:hypothetical protein
MLGMKAAEETCDSVLAISPFIKEEIQLTVQAALPASTPLRVLVSAIGAALLESGHDVDTALPRGATSRLVLRL